MIATNLILIGVVMLFWKVPKLLKNEKLNEMVPHVYVDLV